MYEFSLGYVKKLYEQGLTKADSAAITELRIKKLNESITRVMFTNISRALFEAHKKLYSFLICCEIKKNAKIIQPREWELFSKGPGMRGKNFKEVLSSPDSKLFSEDTWFFLHKFS